MKMPHASEYLPVDSYNQLVKVAEENGKEPKKRLSMNKETFVAGLKMVGAGAAGAAVGGFAGKAVGRLLRDHGVAQAIPESKKLKVIGALGAAIPAAYAMNKRLGRQYLEEAHERGEERKAREH